MNFSWAELRRRKVVRVAVAYVIGAWVLMQVGDTLVGLLELPAWTGKALVVALVLGFPLALVLSWMFDITPGGLEKTGPADEQAPGGFPYTDPEPIDVGVLDLLRPQATPMIGRDQEMAVLKERLEEAAAGRGGLVLIGGEPGAGKTRLGEEALALGHARGMLPLAGHAYEEHGAPFVTSTEILEQLARAVPTENLRNVLGPTAGEITLLLLARAHVQRAIRMNDVHRVRELVCEHSRCTQLDRIAPLFPSSSEQRFSSGCRDPFPIDGVDCFQARPTAMRDPCVRS
jgi:hypothetical protein